MPLPYCLVTLQLGTAVAAAGLLLVFSVEQAFAALLAGVVCILPGGYFAWRSHHERSPGRLLGHGVLKSVLTLGLMALTFAWFKPPPLGFFATFALMQCMYVLVPLKGPQRPPVG